MSRDGGFQAGWDASEIATEWKVRAAIAQYVEDLFRDDKDGTHKTVILPMMIHHIRTRRWLKEVEDE